MPARGPRPVVRLPRAALPGGAIAAGAGLAALLLFVVLEGRRERRLVQPAPSVGDAFPPPPPLVMPPEVARETLPEPPATRTIVATPLPLLPRRFPLVASSAPLIVAPSPSVPLAAAPLEERAAGSTREREPALVLDTVAASIDAPAAAARPAAGGTASATTADDTPIRATVIHNRTTIMPAGTIIPATLETPIDSARPGLVRAIISEDARGFDGKRVLVPRGSRLIGEYQSDVRSSQHRVLVTWTRLLRPDGVAIRIGSPAADALGGAGVPGHLNTFFLRRFAGAVLQSALTVGVNLASRYGSGSVIVGGPTNGVGAIGQGLVPGNDLQPKITVKQGAILNVFVARDLDFAGTPYRNQDEARD